LRAWPAGPASGRAEETAVQADQRIIELLNKVLTFELTAVNQYFLNGRMCSDWGYERLAGRHRAISMDEMHDVEELIDRILFLEGLPNLQRLDHVAVGETPVEQMRLALDLERTAVRNLNDGIALCVEVGDQGTREFLAGMLAEEEQHCDYWETQLAAVDAVGEANYLAQQLHA
jgi:bacterioferritin